ncbi:TIGR04255 family protein [Demequina capsici]|uniref:TIGR04255 family protein n=1 Tax=Demequina capsici TaxID=3075620 RepID=A0AA96JAV2_9MICO|nr:TIGR04255 family protein [Demequina sp. PMTSA13]WNM27358.1 TIGR04255 family protein [Demequina sp. PMTSA13]
MANREHFRPFTGASGRKIELANPPLALVLVQIRWPEHARLARDFETLALDFGARLEDFPLFERRNEQGIEITPQGVRQFSGDSAFQWQTIDEVWTVSLTRHFVTVHCIRHAGYGFGELKAHLERVVGLVSDVLQVKSVNRVGLRYVNRLSSPTVLARLHEAFKPEVLGYSRLQCGEDVALAQTMSQALYEVDDVKLQSRSGTLGPGQTVDPSVAPLTDESWVLDIDASVERKAIFDASEIMATVSRLADVDYDFFTLVVEEGAEAILEGAD